ncbi:MAG: ATP-binding cassette domain-containing protein [Bacteroidota bacterium]
MLKTTNLGFSYDGNNFLHFPDVDCQRGEHWLLLGQSGCGKTTLLHLLGGLRTPQKGIVEVDGQVLNKLSAAALDRFRGQKIGIVFQQAHFLKALTVKENLALAQQLAGQAVSEKRIKEMLERLRIDHKLNEYTNNLSQGEQQRLAIARALVNRPLVILADEPTSALDDVNCEEVVQLLEQQAGEENASLVIVTHDGRLKERFEKRIIL